MNHNHKLWILFTKTMQKGYKTLAGFAIQKELSFKIDGGKMRGIKRVDINLNELKNLYENMKISTRQLCKKYHCSSETLYRKLLEAGVALNKEQRLRAFGKRQIRYFGEKSSNWKGGRTKVKGYVLVRHPNHERASRGYVREHILVWEKTYNRKLPMDHVIHHLNGIKDDNRPENLIALKSGEHIKVAEPYKKRIRELELEIAKLKQPSFLKG